MDDNENGCNEILNGLHSTLLSLLFPEIRGLHASKLCTYCAFARGGGARGCSFLCLCTFSLQYSWAKHAPCLKEGNERSFHDEL